jgi:hypothetical protein
MWAVHRHCKAPIVSHSHWHSCRPQDVFVECGTPFCEIKHKELRQPGRGQGQKRARYCTHSLCSAHTVLVAVALGAWLVSKIASPAVSCDVRHHNKQYAFRILFLQNRGESRVLVYHENDTPVQLSQVKPDCRSPESDESSEPESELESDSLSESEESWLWGSAGELIGCEGWTGWTGWGTVGAAQAVCTTCPHWL